MFSTYKVWIAVVVLSLLLNAYAVLRPMNFALYNAFAQELGRRDAQIWLDQTLIQQLRDQLKAAQGGGKP